MPLAPGATLTARFSRPLVFGQRVAADVVRLGRSALLLRIDDRSIVILPQLPLELELSRHVVRGRVLWTRTTTRGLEFALALARLGRSAARDLAEHVLLTTSTTPRELRAACLPTRAIRRASRTWRSG